MTAISAGDPAMDPDNASPTAQGNSLRVSDADHAATEDAAPAQATADGGSTGREGMDRGIVDQAGIAARIAEVRGRLLSPMPDDGIWGWAGPLLVTAFAAFFRFNRLVIPRALIFDETYYAKDAWSILKHGVEWNLVKNANQLILAGNTHIFVPCSGTSCGEYVVHPPVGKMLMAVGEWLFGLTPLGWRVASALFGSLAILVMCRVARRMTRSTLLGCVAGLLLSLDGLEFVLSRTGILDIFLMFFTLAAFGALLMDRDASRARLAEAVVLRRRDEAGPELGIRWWRVLAGFLIGVACACKQDAIWYIPAFICLAIAWDAGARRAAGLRQPWRGALIRDSKWLPLTLVLIPLLTYIASWSGWFLTSTGYNRDYAASQGMNIPVVSALYSLYNYHYQMVHFGVNLTTPHPYESQPWGWLVISRPVAFFYQCYSGPTNYHVCPSGYAGPEWSQEVLAIGNPAIWWVSIPVMIFCLGWWLTRRDWRAGSALLCICAGWLPWFLFLSRTKFDYYSLEFLPFLILCITLCLGLIIGPARASMPRRAIGATIAGTYVLSVLILFWYFYPILAGQVIPYSSWLAHMWYYGWI